MIVWIDKSDRGTRFFQGESSGEPLQISVALDSMLRFLGDRILGQGNAVQFDLLMLEVNCDTGRLIAGASTEEGWKRGRTDGCSVTVQEIQDDWYELIDAGINDTQLVASVRQRVFEIGNSFKSEVEVSLGTIRCSAGSNGFRLVVFGGTPSDPVIDHVYEKC